MKKNSILRAAFFALLFVASLTAAAQYVVATGNHVRLRTGPSTGYPMLVWNSTGKPVWINKGDRLTYLGQTGNWFKVRYNGNVLYISKDYSYLR